MNTFRIPKGLTEKWKFRGEGGINDFGILRAWGGNAFWNFRRQGGVKILKPSIVVYGYFLELPIEGNKLMLFKCIQQKSERENFKIILQVCLYNRNVTGDHATGLIFKVFLF